MMENRIHFNVSESCNCCGMCSMKYPDYFFETDEGKACAKDGIYNLAPVVVEEVERLCLVHAITTEKEEKSTRQVLAEKLEKLKECKVSYPTKELPV